MTGVSKDEAEMQQLRREVAELKRQVDELKQQIAEAEELGLEEIARIGRIAQEGTVVNLTCRTNY